MLLNLLTLLSVCFVFTTLGLWYALWVAKKDIDGLFSRISMLEFMNDMAPEDRASFDAYRERLKQYVPGE